MSEMMRYLGSLSHLNLSSLSWPARPLEDRTRVQERLGRDARSQGQLDNVPEGAPHVHGARGLPLLVRLCPEPHLPAEGTDALRGLFDGRVSAS